MQVAQAARAREIGTGVHVAPRTARAAGNASAVTRPIGNAIHQPGGNGKIQARLFFTYFIFIYSFDLIILLFIYFVYFYKNRRRRDRQI